jgi:hypothetical protein
LSPIMDSHFMVCFLFNQLLTHIRPGQTVAIPESHNAAMWKAPVVRRRCPLWELSRRCQAGPRGGVPKLCLDATPGLWCGPTKDSRSSANLIEDGVITTCNICPLVDHSYSRQGSNTQTGGSGACIYVPQRQGSPVIPPGTGFPFRCLLRLAGLQWRYSNPPPHGQRGLKWD